MSTEKPIEFSIEHIPEYLKNNKTQFISTNLNLDRHEISKFLTSSLNRYLIGDKKTLEEVYGAMVSIDFQELTKKVESIQKQILEFNNSENNEYIVDPEEILYLRFYKQIVFVQDLITNVNNYINSNMNLVVIFAFVISKLYNEPKNSSNFIFNLKENIKKKFVSSTNTTDNIDSVKLETIFNETNLDIIYKIILLINNSDSEFNQKLLDFKNEKINYFKKKNGVETIKQLESIKSKDGETKDGETKDKSKEKTEVKPVTPPVDLNLGILELEAKFEKEIEQLLIKKRAIKIDELIKAENLEFILIPEINILLWSGYNLFLYKRFNFDFNAFSNKINEILKSKYPDITNLNTETKLLLKLDFLEDLEIPDAGLLQVANLVGGQENYLIKYLKYKNKYLSLKNKQLFK